MKRKHLLLLISSISFFLSAFFFSSKSMNQQINKPNHLISEKSPYLQQHAYNPVNWYPWSEEAFEKAKRDDKPIFLSIGYSTCYWCHVMERECFENDSIAELMNEHFISIKVDREERPDIDRIYMSAVQAMTGSGGWPMSVFLDHDLKPFWGGTYIPPTAKYGRISFPDLLTRLHELWTNDRKKIYEASNSLTEYLQKNSPAKMDSTLNVESISTDVLDSAFNIFSRSYDERFGGFSSAPKFPRPVQFNFLLRYYHRTNNQLVLEMCLKTLKEMWNGGMYDHLGGGFHRYSTDERWRIPHFEKMLYDQAQLCISYLEAYQITKDEFFAEVAKDILRYVQEKMTSSEGGFYSAEDAESAFDFEHPNEKEEGEFYLWKKSEIEKLLGENAELFCFTFGIEENGNALSDPHNVFQNKNVLYQALPLETVAKRFGKSVDEVKIILKVGQESLLVQREQRPKPHLDDKILVSWNGLMISAFAKAYQVLGDETYLHSAENATNFITSKLINKQTYKLFRRYRDGEAKIDGTLEDYAFFVQALLDLYESSFEISHLQLAIKLNETLIEIFYDKENGGFFDASDEDKTLILRTKESYDGAEPSGNSIAILNLLRLSQMLDNKEWKVLAEKSLAYFGKQISQSPHAMPQFLVAVDFLLSTPKEIIIAGNRNDIETKKMLGEVYSRFLPYKILLLADGNEGQKFLSSQNSFLKNIKQIDGSPTAFVCENYVCNLPTTDRNQLAKTLDEH